MERKIRRKDRVWEKEEAVRLLEEGEYGFLAMEGTDGYGYGLPLSFVKEADHLYFHCAPEGYKLECLARNPKVTFCVVGPTQVIPHQFTTAYESVLAFGQMQTEIAEEERRHALRLLVEKYASAYREIGEKYIAKSFHRTHILRLDLETVTAKCKRIG